MTPSQSYLSVDWQSPINWNHPINRGLLAWWLVVPHFKGGTVFHDLLGRFNGTLTNMAPATDWLGPQGSSPNRTGGWGSLNFDGADTHDVQVNHPVLGNTSFSFAAWFSRRTFVNNDFLVDNGNSSDGGMQVFIQPASDEFRVRIDDTGANGGVFDSATIFTTDAWHRVLVTANKNDIAQIYIDGKQDGETLDISGYADISGQDDMVLGGQVITTTGSFSGHLDDMRIWTRALTAEEAAFDFQNSQRFHPGVLRRWHPELAKATATADDDSLLLLGA